MGKLYLYAVFHANLNFSYIPKDMYTQILRRCYWPLLRIVEEHRVPLGLEFSAYTLQVIEGIDPTFVERLRALWEDGTCEVVGSGYVQAIMPLMPARVNRENLSLGNELYEKLLGRRPTVAFVNELVFSRSLPRLYKDAGYRALVVNWDSAVPLHQRPELLYRPCDVPVGDGESMPVVWHCMEAYREFQRYVERETSLDDYLERLQSHVPAEGERSYPLYSSDWEVFDFKPWRTHPDGFQAPELGEMERIARVLDQLKSMEEIQFVTPSSLLEQFPQRPEVQPESAAYPLPYKKQSLHGVTRWAVGGRDSVRLNTQCNQLYQELMLAEWQLEQGAASPDQREELSSLWKDLCYLWNSDFRTFTTEEKYVEHRNRMGAALHRAEELSRASYPSNVSDDGLWLGNRTPVSAQDEAVSFSITSNGAGPRDSLAYELLVDGTTVPCQVTHSSVLREDATKLTLEAQPRLGKERVEIATIRRSTSPRAASEYSVDRATHTVETPCVRLTLLPQRGGAIGSLAFPKVYEDPLALAQEDELVLVDQKDRRISDRRDTELQLPEQGQGNEIFVPVRCSIETEAGTIWKTYRVYLHQPRVDLLVRFQWKDVVPKSFRLGQMSLNAAAFDRSGLYYATTNGGEEVERFPLEDQQVRHDQPANEGASATCCLGATEGWVVLGDDSKGLGFVTRPSQLYSVPMVHYEEFNQKPGGFKLMLIHSLGEQDETSHILWRGHSTWSLSILGGEGDVISQTRASAVLANGGLVARYNSGTGSGNP